MEIPAVLIIYVDITLQKNKHWCPSFVTTITIDSFFKKDVL